MMARMTTRGMTQAAFLVLTALADEPRHGYGILQEVETLSDGEMQMRVGTLYGVLDRLAADGLIVLDREEVQQGRLRRYYRLTDSGIGALTAEAERMAGGARAAEQRMAAGRRRSAGDAAGGDSPASSATPSPASRAPSPRPGLAGGAV
jgi:DNA-binding PadR family transcriptional regulator